MTINNQTTQSWKIGDSHKLIQDLDENSIDLVVTSPPYNVGIDYGDYKDNLPYNEYLTNMENIIKELYRVIGKNRRVVYNVLINMQTDGIMKHPFVDFVNIFKKCGFKIHGTPIWQDPTKPTYTAWGSWMSATSPYFYNPNEILIIAYKGEWKREKGTNTMKKEQFLSMCNGLIKFPTERDREHPAPFSVKMAETIIETLSFKYDNILDPFLGSGTLLEASKNTDRNCIGFDITDTWEYKYYKRLNPDSYEVTKNKETGKSEISGEYKNVLKYFK